MKFNITFKMSDALFYVEKDIREHMEGQHPDADKFEIDELVDDMLVKISRWIEYGEYVRLVYDSEKDTMSIQEVA